MSDEVVELKREKLNRAVDAIDEHIKELQKLRKDFVDKIEEAERIRILLK